MPYITSGWVRFVIPSIVTFATSRPTYGASTIIPIQLIAYIFVELGLVVDNAELIDYFFFHILYASIGIIAGYIINLAVGAKFGIFDPTPESNEETASRFFASSKKITDPGEQVARIKKGERERLRVIIMFIIFLIVFIISILLFDAVNPFFLKPIVYIISPISVSLIGALIFSGKYATLKNSVIGVSALRYFLTFGICYTIPLIFFIFVYILPVSPGMVSEMRWAITAVGIGHVVAGLVALILFSFAFPSKARATTSQRIQNFRTRPVRDGLEDADEIDNTGSNSF
jgi:hypothetical protein